MTAFAILASLLSLQLSGPRAILSPLDAPRVIATIGYSGPGFATNPTFMISARGGTIRPQRGTFCDRAPNGWACHPTAVNHGATEPLSFLVTGLRAGRTLVVTAFAASPQGSARARLRRVVWRQP